MKRIYTELSEFLRDSEKIRKKKKVVFTNGCFDIIHPGHIYLLRKAAEYGDILVVGLNSEESVRKIKGPNRPVMDTESRAAVLAELKPVDFVVVFSSETPFELIKTLRPDVLVKGGEYSPGEIVGEDIVPRTVRVEMKKGFSSTEIIEKLKGSLR